MFPVDARKNTGLNDRSFSDFPSYYLSPPITLGELLSLGSAKGKEEKVKQMYDVEKTTVPQEDNAEQRLHRAARRIREIDKEVAELLDERRVAAGEINRATEELQNSIEKAQHVLRENVEVETEDAGY